MYLKFIILLIFLIFPVSASYNSIILTNNTNFSDTLNTIDFLEQNNNNKITHIYPPNILIGNITSNTSLLLNQQNITLISSSVIPNNNSDIIISSWNNEHTYQSPRISYQSAMVQSSPIYNDIIDKKPALLNSSRIYGATFYDTSEYMIGNIAVGLLFPESDNGTENWTDTQQINTIIEIRNGLDWWINREPIANITFTYDIHYKIPTSYEPITLRGVADSDLWMDDVFSYLNYTNFSDFYNNTLDYNNDIRNKYQTDWAYAIFIVNGNMFSDTLFAYAYLGGPLVVMTYDNDGYSINNMDAVIAHETGHIFYANDQYVSSQRSCNERTGYFDTENQNSLFGSCLSNVPSIMRGQVSPFINGEVDIYARQQIGWKDDNNNSILDILDFNPITQIINFSNSNVYLTSSSNTTYPSSNSLSYTKSSITLNRIKTLQYKLNEDNWTTYLSFGRNASNNILSNFSLPILNNTYTISFHSQNTVGLWSNETSTNIKIDTYSPIISITNITGNDFINITINSSESLNSIILQWNNINETILTNFNKTNLLNGIYNYRVFANDISNNWNVSENYSVIITPVIIFVPNPPSTPTSTPNTVGGSYQVYPKITPTHIITSTPNIRHPIMTIEDANISPQTDYSSISYVIIFLIASIFGILYLKSKALNTKK